MKKGTGSNRRGEQLLKALTAHYESLVSARSDESVLREYEALLRFLRTRKGRTFGAPKRKARLSSDSGAAPGPRVEALMDASLDDVERIVSDDKTSRKELEHIAMYRFSVPSGSMRSFSNKVMLVEKLQTLIRNERAHDTIGEVARGKFGGSEGTR